VRTHLSYLDADLSRVKGWGLILHVRIHLSYRFAYLSISIHIGLQQDHSLDARRLNLQAGIRPRHAMCVYIYPICMPIYLYLSISISGLTHLQAGIRARHDMCV